MFTPSRTRPSRNSSGSTKRTKLATYKKKKQYPKKPIAVRLGRQPVAKQLFNRLKYAETVNITLGVTGLGSYLYSCNGMYDPNITGTGHQPMYFDQYSAMYDHYTVLSSKMKATVVAHIDAALIYSLGQDDDTTINAATSSTIWERPGFQTKVVNTAVEPSNNILWSSWDAKKVFGGDPQSTDSLQGSASANPTEQTYYVIYLDGASTMASSQVTVLVEIWYDVVWDEFVSMVQS